MTVLTEVQRKFLDAPRFAVVSTIASSGMPHQTVMWYMLGEPGEIVLSTPHGSLKHKHLQRDPRLSICVEEGYRYVTMNGTVTLEEEPAAARALYDEMGKHYAGTFTQRPAAPPDSKFAKIIARDRVTLRLKIERALGNGIA